MKWPENISRDLESHREPACLHWCFSRATCFYRQDDNRQPSSKRHLVGMEGGFEKHGRGRKKAILSRLNWTVFSSGILLIVCLWRFSTRIKLIVAIRAEKRCFRTAALFFSLVYVIASACAQNGGGGVKKTSEKTEIMGEIRCLFYSFYGHCVKGFPVKWKLCSRLHFLSLAACRINVHPSRLHSSVGTPRWGFEVITTIVPSLPPQQQLLQQVCRLWGRSFVTKIVLTIAFFVCLFPLFASSFLWHFLIFTIVIETRTVTTFLKIYSFTFFQVFN